MYFLVQSETGKSGLLLMVLAVGLITGVLDVEHTVKNSTKEEFCWLRFDTSVFLAGSYAVYYFRNQVDHTLLLAGLCIPTVIYFTVYTFGVMITISRFLDVPFFSVKRKQQ
jgi:hypothetical protein